MAVFRDRTYQKRLRIVVLDWPRRSRLCPPRSRPSAGAWVALSVDPQHRVRAGTACDHPPSKKEGAMRVNDRAAPLHGSRRKLWPHDGELVAHILAGSREHFEMLYESYLPRVYGFALKRLGDPVEAEDVTQEVFSRSSTRSRASREGRRCSSGYSASPATPSIGAFGRPAPTWSPWMPTAPSRLPTRGRRWTA